MNEKKEETLQTIGDRLTVSKTHVIGIRDGKSSVGPDLERKFAELFYTGSVDELRRVAHERWEKEQAKIPPRPREAPKVEISEEDRKFYPGLVVLMSSEFYQEAPKPVQEKLEGYKRFLGNAKPSVWFALFETWLERWEKGTFYDEPASHYPEAKKRRRRNDPD